MSYEESPTIMDIPEQLSSIVSNPVSFDKSITERNSVRWNAQAIEYGENARQIVIRMNTAGMVDPATCFLGLNLKTKYGGSTILSNGILNLLGNCELYVGGKQVERIENASALLPLLFHSCSEAWLNGEGVASGIQKYVKTKLYETSVANTESADTGNNSVSLNLADSDTSNLSGTAQASIYLPRVGGTYSTVKIGENSVDKCFTGSTYAHNALNCKGKNGNEACFNQLSDGQNVGDKAKTLYLNLGILFGLFRINSYIPVRNLSLEFRLNLRAFNETFITPVPHVSCKLQGRALPTIVDHADDSHAVYPKTGTKISEILTAITDPNYGASAYTISNVHILGDVCNIAPSLANKIDSLAQGSGLQFVLDCYSVSSFPFAQLQENMTLSSSRSYSHLKDIYTTFQPAEIANSTFALKEDRYYGSLIDSCQTMIGSRTMPSSMPQDSIEEMYLSVKKTLGNIGKTGSARGVVSMRNYQGLPEGHGNSYKRAWSHGYIPDLQCIKKTGALSDNQVIRKILNTSHLQSQAHSDFMLAENLQRVLNTNSLSGLNTLASAFQISQVIKFKKFEDADVTSNSLSSANNASLDNCYGNTAVTAQQIHHYDCLLSVAQGMVSVLE